jgi:hypothetical protein
MMNTADWRKNLDEAKQDMGLAAKPTASRRLVLKAWDQVKSLPQEEEAQQPLRETGT